MNNNGLPGRRFFSYSIIIVLIMFAYLTAQYWKALLSPLAPFPGSGEVSVFIPENTSCAAISQMLYGRGLVRGPAVVSIYARLHKVDQRLKPGRYLFSRGQSAPEMVGALVTGPPDLIVFTVPEGYSLSQLTDLMAQKGITVRENFKSSLERFQMQNNGVIKKIPPGRGLEGYLFPDTYHIGSRTSDEQVIRMMLERFESQIKTLDYERKARERSLTLHQAVTIASMIEGEAAVDEERPLISGVIHNRLRLGMPLQIDATVKYALGGQPKKIYYKDLEVDSPYNTYRLAGLPPGPINSPGEASLKAALEPAQTDYLYYVARPDGTHAFASSLEGHNENRKKYQGDSY
ncbi:MAG: hypothetical protein VR68_10280 [Peptococcaceae bacterium BRH_c4a]|nr:MAG: hypothetical protein VR68_10280 [Peptococcaceae bacterium BRH_c4a]